LDAAHMVTYPMKKNFDENAPNPSWYKEHDYCELHHVKGHKIDKFLQLRHYIQDLIDNGEIEVDTSEKNQMSNEKLGIFKEPFPKH
ncbi:hypothetical protein KI387_044490, partial [Taxus chinensis]